MIANIALKAGFVQELANNIQINNQLLLNNWIYEIRPFRQKILNLMQKMRASAILIWQEQVGLSLSPCSRRIKALEESGDLKACHLLNPEN